MLSLIHIYLFKPGNAIRLEVGDIEKENILCDGMIIGLRIITDKDFHSYMLVECRDHAYSCLLYTSF